ncbi:helix-turn-helix transcriptional regulator [Gordonia sp. X0973]|uniref:PadR family transcriptional regulator n=1 Tax=Gordonia sp. X0973 TaxID=2742602 RepID=UPI000F544DCA|nr:helix-turn-helix transcriptional regulator [Gordonia sp. X0973]QKT06828.1 helix-turn-helix transcriptional regulator [Gordonia sp. X0973]
MTGIGKSGQKPLDLLVLSLLVERPMHPYEMAQLAVKRHFDRLVKLRTTSIYHVVERLHAQGLLRVHDVVREGNRPERTVYALTDEGRAAHRATLEHLLAERPVEFPQLYLALAQAHELPREDASRLLRQRRAEMADELTQVVDLVESTSASGVPEVFRLDGGMRIATLRAQIDWLDVLLDRMDNHEIAWLDDVLGDVTCTNNETDGLGYDLL